ncbi:unnamed protein product [Orchesella dallaii]|uniref:Uncharacterized protein n=1 Tax=Orchesella dallaii TaxID=48710 RepID=A0ABP1PVQ4_9HEXA
MDFPMPDKTFSFCRQEHDDTTDHSVFEELNTEELHRCWISTRSIFHCVLCVDTKQFIVTVMEISGTPYISSKAKVCLKILERPINPRAPIQLRRDVIDAAATGSASGGAELPKLVRVAGAAALEETEKVVKKRIPGGFVLVV